MGFGVLTVVSIFVGAWLTNKIKLRFPVNILLCCFPIAGSTALLKLGREMKDRCPLLAAYYVLSVMGGIQPMLYAWAPLTACGHTKKVTTTAVFFIAQCVGNIVGQQMYKTDMQPRDTPSLVTDLVCWCALAVIAGFTALCLHFINRRQAAKRVRMGKAAVVVDTSILSIENAALAKEVNEKNGEMNDQAFDDLTDF